MCVCASGHRDQFCKQLDDSAVGVKATIARLSACLRSHDPVLWDHLELRNKVDPTYYAFRWVTLMLTQELPLPDVLRVWDTLLSAGGDEDGGGSVGDPEGRLRCLLRVCVALLEAVREELLTGDFAQCLKLLQRYPGTDVSAILQAADKVQCAPR